MEPTLLPLVLPSVNFATFSMLLDQATVNKVDGKSRTQMFEELSFLLLGKANASKHLGVAFYVEMPIVCLPELMNLGLPFEYSFKEAGFVVAGIMSGSISTWKRLIESDIRNKMLIAIVSKISKHLV